MPNFKFWLLILLLLAKESVGLNYRIQRTESWTGRWFPYEPTSSRPEVMKRPPERIPMGVPNTNCDDGKTNITMDWDGFFEDYVCSSPRSRYVPNETVDSVIEFENIPKAYLSQEIKFTVEEKANVLTPGSSEAYKVQLLFQAPHLCMNERITYSQSLPTFGPHRPLWPVYGEYKFLPKQRWLHSLEHGGIVALYHPCADLRQIKLLKKLVKSCLRRYVITPSRDLPKERPFGVLAWGARLTMSTVYPNAVHQFIKERALNGPEKLPDDGQYDSYLIEPAVTVSDFEDSKLCPHVYF